MVTFLSKYFSRAKENKNNEKIEIPFFNLSRFGKFDEGIESLKNLQKNYSYQIKITKEFLIWISNTFLLGYIL